MAVVWLGLDDNKKLPFTGSSGALRVWTELMALESPASFMAIQPEGIEYQWIEPISGLLADEQCQGARQIPFIKGSAPTEYSDCVSAQTDTQDSSPNWFQRWFR